MTTVKWTDDDHRFFILTVDGTQEAWRVSDHAMERAADMGIPSALWPEIVGPDAEILDIHPTSKYANSDRLLYGRGKVTAVVWIELFDDGTQRHHLITFLWRTAEAWQKSYKKNPAHGRAARANLAHLPSA